VQSWSWRCTKAKKITIGAARASETITAPPSGPQQEIYLIFETIPELAWIVNRYCRGAGASGSGAPEARQPAGLLLDGGAKWSRSG